ncbi:MAG: LptF/LptG family permease [Pirellulales bacterium]|nr:LptF/LptG family permease [Pirellulales bacterium]
MKILTRYILAELLKWFLVSLSILTLLMVIFGILQQALRRGLPPAQVFGLIPYTLPEALRYSVPGTLLLTATSVYGRLAGSNEILAVKAQGISPRKLLEPIWVMAFLLSLVAVYLNDLAVSWGRTGAQRVVIESVEEIAYAMLQTQGRYGSNSVAINVKSVDGRRLICPLVTFYARGNSPEVTITAAEAKLETNRDEGVLRILLWDATVDYGGRVSYKTDFFEHEMALQDASQAGEQPHEPSRLALRVIPNEIDRQNALIDRHETNQAARAACQMLTGDFETLTSDEWKTNARVLELARERLCKLRTEPQRRWALGFSCLAFAWVGAPMAIRMRNRDLLTSFFLCFLPILVVYYPLLAVGVDGAKDGRLPPWSVWAGNVLLLAWGAYLLRKVIRY